MVVLSAAICTKTGKTLVSRQFVEMNRIRIEGLLAAFPKLINTDAKQQHTFVETESVRYIYQPMEGLYLLLITNRASNIIEDLETLRLLSKVVPNITNSSNNINEEKVQEKCFELIMAFDEVITAGGYREPITMQQITTNMEMVSHEEILHKMIKSSKEESAKEEAAKKAKEIKERQREASKMSGFGSGGIGGGSYGSDNNSSTPSAFESNSPSVSSFTPAATSNTPSSNNNTSSSRNQPVKGMSLGGGSKNKNFEDALMKEDKLAPVKVSTKASASVAATEVAPIVAQHPLMMTIIEKVTAALSREGNVEAFDIKGNLTLTAANDDVAICSIQLKVPNNTMGFAFSTHPKVNKALYDKNGLLQLKDSSKGFPSARPVGILKWSYAGTSEEYIPIKINCWPEEESRGMVNVTIEYNMDMKGMELHDVRIRIPLGTSDAPNIINVDGHHKHDRTAQELIWNIDLIDASNASGSLEFTIQQKNTDAFFPIDVQFSSQQLYCNIDVTSAKHTNTNAPIIYGLTRGMSTEEYVIR